MANPILKATNISKYYRLGVLGSGSLKKDLQQQWRKAVMGQQDTTEEDANSKDHIWALRDIDFTINEGDTVGFIGKNGSGKSTLLKIISRISLPTTGSIKGKGRVASLLEVGTGFHPELSGRENIVLNGQILGMQKKEVLEKFDEIVDFSGVERFIDTPVKRYSSGMYVRLAFAVAAHLNSDILIVDEVLAVGDAEFQKKCLGKMKEVSTQKGKTVLFVSHYAQALRSLCSRAICLENGRLVEDGPTDAVLANYLSREKVETLSQSYDLAENAPGNASIRIQSVSLQPQYLQPSTIIDVRSAFDFQFSFWYLHQPNIRLSVSVAVYQLTGECVFDIRSTPTEYHNGIIQAKCSIPGNFLNDGYYYISLSFLKDGMDVLYEFPAAVAFDVTDYRENDGWFGKWQGAVRPQFPIILQQLNTF